MSDFYQINEIARLYNLHADTLRYYEEQGVLSPARGENGYRRYGIPDICDLNIIQSLRSLDVPLSRIREYMQGRSVESTLELLEQEAALIDGRIAQLEAQSQGVQNRLRRLQRAKELPVGQPRILELPPRPCFTLSEGVTLEGDIDYLLKKLEKKHEEKLRIIGDHQMGAVLEEGALAQGVTNRFSRVFFTGEEFADYDDLIPAGHYASLVYQGDYTGLGPALSRLLAYVAEGGMAPCGAPMELYHIDIHDTNDRNAYLTEVQVGVGKQQYSGGRGRR